MVPDPEWCLANGISCMQNGDAKNVPAVMFYRAIYVDEAPGRRQIRFGLTRVRPSIGRLAMAGMATANCNTTRCFVTARMYRSECKT